MGGHARRARSSRNARWPRLRKCDPVLERHWHGHRCVRRANLCHRRLRHWRRYGREIPTGLQPQLMRWPRPDQAAVNIVAGAVLLRLLLAVRACCAHFEWGALAAMLIAAMLTTWAFRAAANGYFRWLRRTRDLCGADKRAKHGPHSPWRALAVATPLAAIGADALWSMGAAAPLEALTTLFSVGATGWAFYCIWSACVSSWPLRALD